MPSHAADPRGHVAVILASCCIVPCHKCRAGVPLLGHLPAFYASSFFPEQLRRWAQQLGPVYEITLGGEQYAVVTGGCGVVERSAR